MPQHAFRATPDETTSAREEEASGLRQILLFLGLTFGWTWAWWFATIAILHADETSFAAVLTTFAGTTGPALSGWVMWYRRGGSRYAWSRVARCFRPTGPLAAWILGSLGIVAALSVASWVQARWGGAVEQPPPLWLLAPQLLVMLFAGGGQEEVGWRAWLQPALRGHLGRWLTPLAIAGIWFCWHLPLWWTPGAVQTFIPMPAFALSLLGLSLLMSRALEASAGAPAIVVWLHGINNLAASWLIFVTFTSGAPQPGAWTAGAGYVLVGVLAMLIRRRPPATTSLRSQGSECAR